MLSLERMPVDLSLQSSVPLHHKNVSILMFVIGFILFHFTGFGYQSNRNVCAGSVLVSLEVVPLIHIYL